MTISMKMRLTNEKDTDFLIVDPFLMACAGTDGGSLRRSIGKCSAPSPPVPVSRDHGQLFWWFFSLQGVLERTMCLAIRSVTLL